MNIALDNDDLETYKRLFDDYIYNLEIYNNYTYDEQGIACDHHFSVYSYCTCREVIKSEDMTRIHRHNSKVRCNCVNGKYYLALCDAYLALTDNCDFSPKSLNHFIKREKLYNKKSKIIDWLFHLNYPVNMSWESLHLDYKGKYPLCFICDNPDKYEIFSGTYKDEFINII